MKPKGKLILTLFLITWTAFAVVSFLNNSQNYLFKSYFDSDYFQSNKTSFVDQLGNYVLTPFDPEEAKEKISVTQQEIDYYRHYYGTLPEQLQNIREQYSEQILQAEESEDAALKKFLIDERDGKMKDVTKNFESDEYVEKKILKQKESDIDRYAMEQARQRQEFLNEYKHYAYHFVNTETGENFSSEMQPKNEVYQESFNESKTALLTVDNTEYINAADSAYAPDAVLRIDGGVSKFEGSISIPKSMMNNSNFASEYHSFTRAQTIFYILWITGILAIVGLCTAAKPSKALMQGPGRMKEVFARIPIDVRLLIILVAGMISIAMMDTVGNTIQNFYQYTPNIRWFEIVVSMIVMFIAVTIVILGLTWTWDSISNEEKFKKELKNAMLHRVAGVMQDVFLNRFFGIQAVAVIIVAFLAGIGFVGAAISGGELVLIYIVLFFFIALPVFFIFLRYTGYWNRIMKQTQEMAEGRLTSEIKVKGKSIFANHARNLNALREGVRTSMTEQAKSERLKTELITNVSHDLRTPLTSIITYTELLKNPNLTEAERAQYIDVLDKKSARLKTLIEDLFEVSKMASGNIELTKQYIDLTQLMQQAIGEHKEAFANANLDLRVSMLEQPLYAVVDGQKIWRVIDNLIVNALKYSMEGTRVYVALKQHNSMAEFTVKNVSQYELNDNVEELTERFKRADASRHTDGSGLGLAIAQSIVDLHHGRMTIEVDGDLFKVTVFIPTEKA
ncbi:sensor histidine kinase [Lysinibacillus yapensis]|uniref:histidine kinase n=1 Tax=Ureibacillus yapensis TaxID=2304605 RepID=A0A396S5M9_9BACL|nr:HAMP domain-containing sensor histidine kinase [Lysinibacillus yapensis]RHW35810.1 sensor histidine kinase [Lysinibacillus yapensis]